MKSEVSAILALIIAATLVVGGCGKAEDPSSEAPPPAQVDHEQDGSLVQVDHPEQFPLSTAAAHKAKSQLAVTGVVAVDVSRSVPVISLASGRVIDIRARLGDTVRKGQLMMRIESSDISSAFSDYRKALADEALASTQLDREKDLYSHGAVSQNDFQVAEDTENKAKVDVETTAEHLRLLGSDLNQPTGVVDIAAPISGVITDQEITNAGSVQAFGTNPFTISDLSYVWVLCDVHEDDLPNVHLNDTADIRLDAYPGVEFKGTINNIGAILDPNIRTAKVRVEVRNSGLLRIGMFVTANFHGQKPEIHAEIPAAAILHLRDREWVYVPQGAGRFRRVEVVAGDTLPGNMQEVVSGIQPGTQVVSNALTMQNTVEQ